MFRKNKILKKILKVLQRNYFLTVIFAIIVFVGLIVVLKYITSEPNFFYARVQVSYPASYFSKPDFWLVKSLKSDVKQYNILGRTEAQLISVRYYPNQDGSTFNIYLTVKLAGGFNRGTQQYTFQRSQIGVGSPIALNFSSSQFYGTVVDLSSTPFKDKYVEKTLYLVNRSAFYKDDPSVYDSIQIGDKYFDGMNDIFVVTDKSLQKNIFAITNNFTGQVLEGQTDATQNIVVKAKILVLEKNGQAIFAGNQILHVGSKFTFSTSNFDFSNFVISSIY